MGIFLLIYPFFYKAPPFLSPSKRLYFSLVLFLLGTQKNERPAAANKNKSVRFRPKVVSRLFGTTSSLNVCISLKSMEYSIQAKSLDVTHRLYGWQH
jgi:hypothetical protein